MKQQLGFDPAVKFAVPSKVYDYFAECKEKGKQAEEDWNTLMQIYATKYSKEFAELELRLKGKFTDSDWAALLPAKKDLPSAPQPTRKSSGIVVQALVPKCQSFVAGSADLLESTFVNFDGQVEFQNVSIHIDIL